MKKIIYICSFSHSGSTLLNLLLGGQQGVDAFGEIEQTIRSFNHEDDSKKLICTCGESIDRCIIWAPLFKRIIQLKKAPPLSLKLSVMLHNSNIHSEMVLLAARSLLSSSNCDVIVDSSKSLNSLKTLLKRGFDVKIIHLVRDGRAVAHSHKKKNRTYDEYVTLWSEFNRRVDNFLKMKARPGQSIQVRYEDLVKDPIQQLERIFINFDLKVKRPQLDWTVKNFHHIRGNRMRFSSTPEIKPDIEYLKAIKNEDWKGLTDQLVPDLEKYGYPTLSEDMLDFFKVNTT